MSLALNLANALHRFNAKERNFLMRFALLGEVDSGPRASSRWVDPVFFEALKLALESSPMEYGATAQIKLGKNAECIYAAMDYHLEWLHATLWSVGQSDAKFEACPIRRHPETTSSEPEQYDVMGNQEDADLVLVIEDDGHTYLILIEGKGDSSFSRSQLASKLARLKLILDRPHVPPPTELTFALVLLAPADKLTLGRCRSFPELADYPSALDECSAMRYPPTRLGEVILRMPMPNFPDVIDLVTRCDCDESGNTPPPSNDGDRLRYWKVAPRRRAKAIQASNRKPTALR